MTSNGTPYLQMSWVGLHSTSGRRKKREKGGRKKCSKEGKANRKALVSVAHEKFWDPCSGLQRCGEQHVLSSPFGFFFPFFILILLIIIFFFNFTFLFSDGDVLVNSPVVQGFSLIFLKSVSCL